MIPSLRGRDNQQGAAKPERDGASERGSEGKACRIYRNNKGVWGEMPAAGNYSKDDVNSPEKEFRDQLCPKVFKRIRNSDK